MTSTLPNFSAPTANPAGCCGLNFAAMTGSAPAAGTPVAGSTPLAEGITCEFASLLLPTPSVAAKTSPVAPAALPAGESPTIPPPGGIPVGETTTVVFPTTVPVNLGRPAAMDSATVVAAPAAGAIDPSSVEHATGRPHVISREELEHAAAFVAVLMQSLAPAAPVAVAVAEDTAPDVGDGGELRGNVSTEPQGGRALGVPPRSPQSPIDFKLPDGRPLTADLPLQARVAFAAGSDPTASGESMPQVSRGQAGQPVLTDPVVPIATAPEFTVSADGAIELTLNLAENSPAETNTEFPSTTGGESSMEVFAELELPGQAVVRVEATVPAPLLEPHAFDDRGRPVNFAGPRAAENPTEKVATSTDEINFVSSGDKQVTVGSSESGISVAKSDSTMRAAPIDETHAPRNSENLSGLPARIDFQGVQSPAERIPASPTEPALPNFAERAVATVTGLAEAQITASMHKSGSVQLRLKFGHEDLSVRVELRDGIVHTDFRTDSPALREALSREWQAVAAAAPGQLQRFLDPVFSPGSPSSSTDSGAQQHAGQRSPSHQQPQDQSSSRHDVWHSQSPFTRRSALSESFVPEPSATRVAVLLPTSLRLSALA